MAPKARRFFFIFLLLFVIFFSFSTNVVRRQRGGFISDESSYFSIIQSLVYDQDIRYTREDIQRIREQFWVGPQGLFLKKGKDGGLFYAKSFAYPLFAAPFFWLFRIHGLLLFNGLMVFLTIVLSYLLLKRYHPPGNSFSFALMFIGGSIAWMYIWWMTADLFNFFTVFMALFFFFYPFKQGRLFYLSGFFWAAAIFSKPTNVVTAGVVMLILLYRKQWKRFLILSLITLCLLSAAVYFYYSQTGQANFMGGERRSFYYEFPYEKPGYSFESGFSMTADTYWQRFYLTPEIAILNLFYFFFGRFTGIFIYFFPAVFLLALFCIQKKEAEDWFIGVAIFWSVATLIILDPENYFGGAGSLGNRYFLNLYPLFFYMGLKNRSFRFPAVPILAAAIFLSPMIMDTLEHSAYPGTAAKAFPIKLFPAEKTQFKTLPSNVNPRAYDRPIVSGESRYWLYLINDNFNPIENNEIWTYGRNELEFFLVAPKRVREFIVEFANIPLANRVTFQIEQKRADIRLRANEKVIIPFKKIAGLKVDRGYIYHVKIKSEKEYTPFFQERGNEDRRLLGIRTRIELGY